MDKIGFREIKDITKVSIMAVIIFLSTYLIKMPVLQGYIHLGDCFIFLSVYLLGTRNGAIASAIGAGLADLIGGFFVWVIPTVFIKSIMAILMGVISLKILKEYKHSVIFGSVLSGVLQVVLYASVNILLYGNSGIFVTIISDTVQTAVGVGIFLVIYYCFEKIGLDKLLK